MKKKRPTPKAPQSFQATKLTKNLSRILLEYIKGKRYEPETLESLISHLAIPPIHEKTFQSILKHLVETKILQFKNGKFFLSGMEEKLVTGTISIHKKGFGFVKAPSGPDIFIPKHCMREAVDGDTVEVKITANTSPKGPEGEIIAILKRSRTHLACIIIQKSKRHFTAFAPLLGKDKPVTVKAKPKELKEGDRVIAKVINWKTADDLVEAELTRIIGHISDPSIDIEAAIEEFELPDGFSLEAIEEAKSYGAKISAKEAKNRLDLTQEECITIDPDTAKDFDDAITLTCDDLGTYHLGVHIADVAHYVKPTMHLDKEAYLRCNSTYFPGRCIPMLPEELSNELCSLKPNVKRLTMSVLASFDKEGTLLDYKIARTIIKSKKRFTYKEAFDVLQKKKKSVHENLLKRMVDLCLLFKKKRFERGSIDFALTENVIIIDKQGVPLRLEKVEYDITHQMIEEFMLKANELTAIHLANLGKNLIYRVHESPSNESFQDFYSFARSLGFFLPPSPDHKDIQALFYKAKDSPLFHQLSVAFIRSMKLAQYSQDNIGHYGLALDHYCHFTSPIRRYTDLIIQRLLFDEIKKDENLEKVAQNCSDKERVSFKAESSVKFLKKLRLANSHFIEDPNKIYRAVVTKIKPFALYFEVQDFDLESSLHISEIGNDYYEFNPKTLKFKGTRTGKVFSSGDTIYVKLLSIDYILQESKWSISSPPPTLRASKKSTSS